MKAFQDGLFLKKDFMYRQLNIDSSFGEFIGPKYITKSNLVNLDYCPCQTARLVYFPFHFILLLLFLFSSVFLLLLVLLLLLLPLPLLLLFLYV